MDKHHYPEVIETELWKSEQKRKNNVFNQSQWMVYVKS